MIGRDDIMYSEVEPGVPWYLGVNFGKMTIVLLLCSTLQVALTDNLKRRYLWGTLRNKIDGFFLSATHDLISGSGGDFGKLISQHVNGQNNAAYKSANNKLFVNKTVKFPPLP